jgi:hypothetical protein
MRETTIFHLFINAYDCQVPVNEQLAAIIAHIEDLEVRVYSFFITYSLYNHYIPNYSSEASLSHLPSLFFALTFSFRQFREGVFSCLLVSLVHIYPIFVYRYCRFHLEKILLR